MAEARATLRIELANAAQVLTELKQLREHLDALSRGGIPAAGGAPGVPGGPGVPGVGAGPQTSATQMATPPLPMAHPVAVSPTAAMAGTPGAAAQLSQSLFGSMSFGMFGWPAPWMPHMAMPGMMPGMMGMGGMMGMMPGMMGMMGMMPAMMGMMGGMGRWGMPGMMGMGMMPGMMGMGGMAHAAGPPVTSGLSTWQATALAAGQPPLPGMPGAGLTPGWGFAPSGPGAGPTGFQPPWAQAPAGWGAQPPPGAVMAGIWAMPGPWAPATRAGPVPTPTPTPATPTPATPTPQDPSTTTSVIGGSLWGGMTQKGMLQFIGGITAAQMLTHQFIGPAHSATGELGAAVAEGRTFHPARMIPDALGLGLGIIAGGITALATRNITHAAWAFAGGNIAGGELGNLVRQPIERGVLQHRMRHLTGGLAVDPATGEEFQHNIQQLNALRGAWTQGMPISPGMAAALGGDPRPPLPEVDPRALVGGWENSFLPLWGAGRRIWRHGIRPTWDWITHENRAGLIQRDWVEEGLTAFGQLQWSPGALAALGPPDWRSTEVPTDDAGFARAMATVMHGMASHPGAAFHFLSTLDRTRLRPEQALLAGILQGESANITAGQRIAGAELGALGAEGGVAQMQLQLAGRLHGAAGYAGAIGAAQSNIQAQAAQQRELAALAAGNPVLRRQHEAAARQLELSLVPLTIGYHDLRTEEYMATGGLGIGRADRAYQAALYGGAAARDLPFAERQASRQWMATQIEQDIQRRAAAGVPYSPAQLAQLQEQIEAHRFEATVGLARQQEQAIIREDFAGVQMVGAQHMASNIRRILRAGVEGQTEIHTIELANLERKRTLLQQILEQSQLLTREERLQLETRIENIRIDEERLQMTRLYAQSQARESIFGVGQVEARGAVAAHAVRGVRTYAEQAGLRREGQALAAQSLTFYQAEDARLAAEGLPPEDQRRLMLRQSIAHAGVALAQAQRDVAQVPLTDDARGRLATLTAHYSLAQMGIGRFGDVRHSLMGMMGVRAEQIRAIQAREAELAREFDGNIPPAMIADLREQHSQAVTEFGQLMQQYDEGFEHRLISQAYNMPGRGRLFQSQFTRREAALAMIQEGIHVPRSFGGPQALSEAHRMAFPRIRGMLGSGAGGMVFTDRALGGEGREIHVTVQLQVQDETGGRVRIKAHDVSNYRTAQAMNENADAQHRRP